MPDEFSLYGVLTPTLIVLAALACLVWMLLKKVLVRIGVYRYVWHPPLFEVAVYVLILGALFYLFIPNHY